MIEVKVSYDEDRERAERDCGWWAALALSGDEKAGVEDPIEMERLADANRDRASSRFIVSDDPQEMADRIGEYVDLGFTELDVPLPGRGPAPRAGPLRRATCSRSCAPATPEPPAWRTGTPTGAPPAGALGHAA